MSGAAGAKETFVAPGAANPWTEGADYPNPNKDAPRIIAIDVGSMPDLVFVDPVRREIRWVADVSGPIKITGRSVDITGRPVRRRRRKARGLRRHIRRAKSARRP